MARIALITFSIKLNHGVGNFAILVSLVDRFEVLVAVWPQPLHQGSPSETISGKQWERPELFY